MANPPATPPSSDIEGVNRDARVGSPSKASRPDPGAEVDKARDGTAARPEGEAPSPEKGG